MASRKEIALEMDARGDIFEAAKSYEKAIAEEEVDLETYLNLAVIYYLAADPGFAHTYHLTIEYVNFAWPRAVQILGSAEKVFGINAEIDFWRYYMPWALMGDEFEDAKAIEIFDRGETLVPLIFLGDEFMKTHIDDVLILYAEVANRRTERKRYIAGVLTSNARDKELLRQFESHGGIPQKLPSQRHRKRTG